MKNIMIISLMVVLLQSCSSIQTYKINEPFNITLENEGIGGYQWHYMAIPEVEKIDSTTTTISEDKKLDAYIRNFELKGIKKGKYVLEFQRLRAFENLDTIPDNQIKKIKIKIKE